MSIGAVRMHRGHEDGVALCGNHTETVDAKPEEQSIKMAIQFITGSSSFLEEGKRDAFPSLPWTMPRVKWFGGKQDDVSQEKTQEKESV